VLAYDFFTGRNSEGIDTSRIYAELSK